MYSVCLYNQFLWKISRTWENWSQSFGLDPERPATAQAGWGSRFDYDYLYVLPATDRIMIACKSHPNGQRGTNAYHATIDWLEIADRTP